jgi:N6-adenosine-specific RNA methylase IME4
MAYGHARRMAPHVQAIDLFSRQEREGFDCFGNEVGKFQEDAA